MSHADTIRRAIDYRSRFADKADDAIDALLAENRRLRDALERIAEGDISNEGSGGSRHALRDYAREALAGDAE